MSLAATQVVSLVRGIRILRERGVDLNASANSPTCETDLCDRIGVFKTNANERELFRDLINGWYLGLGVNRSGSARFSDTLRSRYADYFDSSRRIRRRPDTTSRMLQVSTHSFFIESCAL
jgi:hypothetical protein